MIDPLLLWLFGGVLTLLVIASVVAWFLLRSASRDMRRLGREVGSRTKSWWIMSAVFAIAVATGGVGSIVLFCAVSFLALREFVTIVPTARADHRALFWLFFIIVPIQYWLIFVDWYGLFVLFIPVYCFLFLPVRIVSVGDTRQFLERTAKIHWGLMACVYCVSHAPALMKLNLSSTEVGAEGATADGGAVLLLYLVLIVELCDIAQYIWGKALGRHKVLPSVSPNKTWEGLIGGVLTAALLGMALYWVTPFAWWQAFLLALGTGLLGFFGDVTMSAIKRDSGKKDFGELLPGHGGMLDRIDSMCFSAPFFFHMTRFYGTGAIPVGF